MTLSAINDKAKCAGQDNTGNHVCSDRNRCGRYLRPAGDRQWWSEFWRAGDSCQSYEIVPVEFHKDDGWNDERIEIIARNGNDGLHYEEVA